MFHPHKEVYLLGDHALYAVCALLTSYPPLTQPPVTPTYSVSPAALKAPWLFLPAPGHGRWRAEPHGFLPASSSPPFLPKVPSGRFSKYHLCALCSSQTYNVQSRYLSLELWTRVSNFLSLLRYLMGTAGSCWKWDSGFPGCLAPPSTMHGLIARSQTQSILHLSCSLPPHPSLCPVVPPLH